jgi:hypothetical protein
VLLDEEGFCKVGFEIKDCSKNGINRTEQRPKSSKSYKGYK